MKAKGYRIGTELLTQVFCFTFYRNGYLAEAPDLEEEGMYFQWFLSWN